MVAELRILDPCFYMLRVYLKKKNVKKCKKKKKKKKYLKNVSILTSVISTTPIASEQSTTGTKQTTVEMNMKVPCKLTGKAISKMEEIIL